MTPTNDNAPWQARVGGKEKTDDGDFASDNARGKALAVMRARAALCGCSLHEMADGTFLVARWNYSKAVPCLRAVGDLLRLIGGR